MSEEYQEKYNLYRDGMSRVLKYRHSKVLDHSRWSKYNREWDKIIYVLMQIVREGVADEKHNGKGLERFAGIVHAQGE